MTRVTEAVEEADRLRRLATDLAAFAGRVHAADLGVFEDDDIQVIAADAAELSTRARTELGLS